MKKAKATDEKKEEYFENWKASAEHQSIMRFVGARAFIKPIDETDADLTQDIQQFLDELLILSQELKIPGRKAKTMEQEYIRTMFFPQVNSNQPYKKKIDGVWYEISNAAYADIGHCKECIVEIYNELGPQTKEEKCTVDNYNQWKKDLIKLLKRWDQLYVKHAKTTYNEMHNIHMAAMKPLTNLMIANESLNRLEILLADKNTAKDIPAFRAKALEAQFSKQLSIVCQIFKKFGSLKDDFNIEQMLATFKIEEGKWDKIAPLAFYLNPLASALKEVRQTLLKMQKQGPLFIKYVIEENKELQDQTITMVKKDQIVQLLMGTELKKDQFRFFFDTCKIIFDSVLKSQLLAHDKIILDSIIPKLIAFKSVMILRNIQLRKAREAKLAKEKEARDRLLNKANKENIDMAGMSPMEQEIYQRLQLEQNAEYDKLNEKQKAERQEQMEIRRYGRLWMQEGYFNLLNKQQWLDTADILKTINEQVLEDIEDYILLEAFGDMEKDKIAAMIDADCIQRIKENKLLLPRNKASAYHQEAMQEMKKRKFLDQMRPPNVWGFLLPPNEPPIKHVLRAETDPKACYTDGRIEAVLNSVETIARDLQTYNHDSWALLLNHTVKVFQDEHEKHLKALEAPVEDN